MSTNAPKDPPRYPNLPAHFPAPPPKQLGTVRIEVQNTQEAKGAWAKALDKIAALEAENKDLKAQVEALNEALAHWQRIVRIARDKDSTLPDPEAS